MLIDDTNFLSQEISMCEQPCVVAKRGWGSLEALVNKSVTKSTLFYCLVLISDWGSFHSRLHYSFNELPVA